MASYTKNILLTLREPSDTVEIDGFNRDNEILDELLKPVAEDYGVLRSAARINSYNTMKAIRAASYGGISVPEKNSMFFGDFDTAADATSDGTLHCSSDHSYQFSDYVGESYAHGASGDVACTLGATECSFSFAAPASGYITSMEIDAKALSSGTNCYLNQCYFGSTYKHNVKIALTTSRAVRTLDFTTPIAIHKGEMIYGSLKNGTSEGTGYVYSAELGVPYIKFNITPAPETGWVKTAVEDLGSMGHSEARAYIQVLKTDDAEIGASLIDSDGTELEMRPDGVRTTVTKDGGACQELCFTVPYSKTLAALKITADAGDGYADIYNYAVTVL